MTTKPDFQMIRDMHDNFRTANMGVISDHEAQQVRAMLELDARTDIELQNCRDMCVMLYSQWADKAKAASGLPDFMKEMDAMSAVTAVIDKEKGRRGLPV